MLNKKINTLLLTLSLHNFNKRNSSRLNSLLLIELIIHFIKLHT